MSFPLSRPARALKRVFGPLASVFLLAGLAACGDAADPGANLFLSADQTSTQEAPPTMRWGERSGAEAWTKATLNALDRHGDAMVANVPGDIATFCPGYATQDEAGRQAFWAGLMSALAKHESTWNPQAKGGGGKWLGLMQIAPATWRGYGCEGNILNGADNMACAIKIASVQVGRDNAVASNGNGWRGVARDWAPMRSAAKRADIANWTARQSYCSVES